MYYHAREIQYVRYGKVGPPPAEAIDPNFNLAYRWLGQHCGFYPQVWLSRSVSGITGFRQRTYKKMPPLEKVLFAFDTIQGFPLDYDFWCLLLMVFWNEKNLKKANQAVRDLIQDHALDSDLQDDPITVTWHKTHNIQEVLSRHLFVKHDQIVVPQLNLKAAKQVICRNEHQKKSLRRMGFIEDRIIIRGYRPRC